MSALEDRYQMDLSETRLTRCGLWEIWNACCRSSPTPRPPATRREAQCQRRFTIRCGLCGGRSGGCGYRHYLLMRPAILLLGWPRVEGREHLRGVDGPLLVISNHVGDVDPGFLLTALPARFRHRLATATGGEALEALRTPAADRGFFARIYDRIRWFLGVSLLNLFPLPREAGFRRSFGYAGEAVIAAIASWYFPKGGTRRMARLNPFRAGVGLLAGNLGIPVLPMRIDGLFEVKQAGKKVAPPKKIRVRIGVPRRFLRGREPEKIANELQRASRSCERDAGYSMRGNGAVDPSLRICLTKKKAL